jgi:hypothetical protein
MSGEYVSMKIKTYENVILSFVFYGCEICFRSRRESVFIKMDLNILKTEIPQDYI